VSEKTLYGFCYYAGLLHLHFIAHTWFKSIYLLSFFTFQTYIMVSQCCLYLIIHMNFQNLRFLGQEMHMKLVFNDTREYV
jgi:hypothetical protein